MRCTLRHPLALERVLITGCCPCVFPRAGFTDTMAKHTTSAALLVVAALLLLMGAPATNAFPDNWLFGEFASESGFG